MSDLNEKRTGYEEAAKALTERAAGHYRMKNYELQDECLQCASMLHDMKPAARRAPAAAPAPVAAIPTWQARCAWVSDAPATLLMVQAMKQEIADLRAALAAAPPAPAAAPIVQPVAWIRFRSDGAYEGPIMDAAMEDVRRKSGAWTPLYAAPTPASSTADTKDAARLTYDEIADAVGDTWPMDKRYNLDEIEERLRSMGAAITSSAGEVKHG